MTFFQYWKKNLRTNLIIGVISFFAAWGFLLSQNMGKNPWFILGGALVGNLIADYFSWRSKYGKK